MTLINAYSEGVYVLSSDVGMNPDLQSSNSNGFEVVRQLTMECTLRTRSEALSFRTALAHKSFTLHASETSPSTVVTDTTWKIDYYENALVAVLLRSLLEAVKTFCLHHTSRETHQSFGAAALRWEQQQRAVAEFRNSRTS